MTHTQQDSTISTEVNAHNFDIEFFQRFNPIADVDPEFAPGLCRMAFEQAYRDDLINEDAGFFGFLMGATLEL